MPNWCNNVVTINSDDPEQIKRIEAAVNQGKLFEEFMPFPNGEWDYGWCVENWGTKWDARVIDYFRDGDNSISITFETAWGPPLTLYSYLYESDEGWEIDAYYNEPGMCFAGTWYNGSDDLYEYAELSADEIDEELPEELNEMYAIAQYKRDWEEENEDEDEDEEEN